MRSIFFGTPEPAAKLLGSLINKKHEIICVVTQPDRPRGRGQKLTFSPVKEIALKYGLPVEQPETVKHNAGFKALLESLKPDIAIVAAYGKLLPGEILEIPKFGFINVHASLLPKYRGAAPIQWALLNGERETGVTIFKLTELLDAGPMILQERVEIDGEDNAETLLAKIFAEGEKVLIKALGQIEKGKAKYTPQNEAAVTFAPSITKESGEIDWRKSASEIHDRIRALISWPTAHTFYKGKRLKILRSEVAALDLITGERSPGAVVGIVKDEGLIVNTGSGNLLIKEVQPAAGKRMKAYDFILGHGIKTGEILPN